MKEKVWFPAINYKVEEIVKNCLACQANTPEHKTSHPITMSPLPEEPWTELSLDIMGPISPNQDYIFVLMDDYSRFPIVQIIKNTTSSEIIQYLQ